MNSTRIVTSFIQDDKNNFLILKRSASVKSMPGLWSGVSGIIENNEKALTRAKIEIYEELGVAPNKIKLIKTGQKVRVTSQSSWPSHQDKVHHVHHHHHHQWEIHPFLFGVAPNNELSDHLNRPKITLNWENSEYKWATINEIADHKTVPSLLKVLVDLL